MPHARNESAICSAAMRQNVLRNDFFGQFTAPKMKNDSFSRKKASIEQKVQVSDSVQLAKGL